MSLRARFLLAFLLPAAIIFLSGGFFLYRLARNALEEQLGTALSQMASSVSSQLKAERIFALTSEDATPNESRTYKTLLGALDEIRMQTKVKRIFVFDEQGRARIDSGGPLVPMGEAPELQRDALELRSVFSGHSAASQVLFFGVDGQPYKTGYAPVSLNSQVVGGVAIEGSAAFFGPLIQLRNALLVVGLCTFLLLTIAALWSARALSSPIQRLVTAALRIGQGDLLTRVAPEPTKELHVLSGELEFMRVALFQREEQLKMMLAGVAHEVKNPLGGIELFTGLLGEELVSERPNINDARSHAQKIQLELNYLKRIVDDFLTFAREHKLQKTTHDSLVLLGEARGLLLTEANEKSVALDVIGPSVKLEVDHSLFIGALVNLTKNAIAASSSGQRVSLVGASMPGQFQIEIIDEGSGIPEDKLPHIFEPFFTTKEKGTGLGLPLTRKIVEAHGGRLSVTSEPRRTTFTILLPLLPTAAP
jgi:signal transduction histidine kinase